MFFYQAYSGIYQIAVVIYVKILILQNSIQQDAENVFTLKIIYEK